jgi:hypothetical protein
MNDSTKCNAIHDVEFGRCPNCDKPIAVLRGLDADCRPIAMVTHRVSPNVIVPR